MFEKNGQKFSAECKVYDITLKGHPLLEKECEELTQLLSKEFPQILKRYQVLHIELDGKLVDHTNNKISYSLKSYTAREVIEEYIKKGKFKFFSSLNERVEAIDPSRSHVLYNPVDCKAICISTTIPSERWEKFIQTIDNGFKHVTTEYPCHFLCIEIPLPHYKKEFLIENNPEQLLYHIEKWKEGYPDTARYKGEKKYKKGVVLQFDGQTNWKGKERSYIGFPENFTMMPTCPEVVEYLSLLK